MKRTLEELDTGQLEMMWNFLRIGYQKPNVPALKESCNMLRKLLIQKTAGQKEGISFEDIGTLINCIVIEALCLYLSGDLDKLEAMQNEQ